VIEAKVESGSEANARVEHSDQSGILPQSGWERRVRHLSYVVERERK